MSVINEAKANISSTINDLNDEINRLSNKLQRLADLEMKNSQLTEQNAHLENEIKILKSDFMELKNFAGSISSQLDENIYTIKDILDSKKMPEITVNINDQNYAIVCDPGEENHLKQLSSKIDTKVRELTGRFGKIGETRLMVMAALLIADEVQDLNSNLEKGIQKIEELEILLKSKDQELINNETANKDFVNESNSKLNDLLTKLSSIN